MGKLDLANVIRVTLLAALRGLSNVNTSALAIITSEVPIPGNFGTSRAYLNPIGVGEDFGSDSDVFRLAQAVFRQNPNILTGGGFLVVIPRLQAAEAQPATILSSGPVNLLTLTAQDYVLRAAVSGAPAAELEIGEIDVSSLEAAEADLNSAEVTAAGLVFSLSGEVTAASVTLKTIATGAATSIALEAAGYDTDVAPPLRISGSAFGADAGLERIKDAILRTSGAVDYFGILLDEKPIDATLQEIAALVQSLDKLLFVGSSTLADIAGVFTTMKDAGLTHTRCLYYSASAALALDFAAGYAGRGLSVNFDGANTAHTMHLKEVIGLEADDLLQATLDAARSAGVDVYADFGVPKLFTSGANQFFDQVYTRLAFLLRLRIAGFNYLARTNTKIPQTEGGMNGLKGELRKVCDRFVGAGVFAPGTWNDPTTFGNPEDHVRNIKDVGYFVYSLPISAQSQVEREFRVAPAVYIAAKDSGAIHSADVLVYVEA